MRDFQIWKTVSLGNHPSPDAYRAALDQEGIEFRRWGESSLLMMHLEETKGASIELVLLSFDDLGLKDVAEYSAICRTGQDLGLRLCPQEVGPALRLQYLDQPRGERVLVAMSAIVDHDAEGCAFCVGNEPWGARYLEGDSGSYNDLWSNDTLIAFSLRK